MKRLLLVALLAAGVGAGTARADAWLVVPSAPVLSTLPANGSQIALPSTLSTPPTVTQSLTPEQLLPIWQAAGQTYGIPWQVLAAINKVESDFGRNMGPSSAGAIGWMQFMPSTWLAYGTDGNGDGVADPWNAEDAIYSAARYLADSGGQSDLRSAVFAYNHADWYVKEVLDLAGVYEAGGSQLAGTLDSLNISLQDAQREIVDSKTSLGEALARVRGLESARRGLDSDAASAELLADRLEAAQEAGQLDAQLAEARGEVTGLRRRLRLAEQALTGAQQNAASASFAGGAGYLLGAPSVQGSWVFPVGGGPDLVSVAHTHHDYPAADIAAPAGSPVYALADADVVEAWSDPQGNCGIGMTIKTADGRSWTYCHLAYLDGSVTVGARLTAGQNVGLVGQTGHATGPHLHLQFSPAASYPQDESWFAGFSGRAYRWQEQTASDTGGLVFAVIGS